MADYTGWILLGGGVITAVYLYSTGALNGFFGPPGPPPSTPQMPMIPQIGQPVPDPNAYYDSYGMIPGIQALIPTPGIIAQAPPEYLLPLSPCLWESQLYYNPSIWAANKIWELQYQQLAQTIAVRNQLALMRCGMVNFYHILPWDVYFRNPFLDNICRSKRIIVDEFNKGTRDSARANSAARDAATAAHPITVKGGSRTSTSAGPSPGENTPPIHAGGGGSTHPTTMSHQAVVTPIAGGAAKMTPPPSYDQSLVTPCLTGDC